MALTKEEKIANLEKGRQTAKRNREEKQRILAAQAEERTGARPAPVEIEVEAEPEVEPDEALLDAPVGELEVEDEPEAVDAVAEERAARRARMLAETDAETAALFTDDELEKIEREEREKALADRKKQAMRNIRATAQHLARVENDLIPADTLRSDADWKRLNEPVTFRVDLPGDGAGHRGQNGVRLDGVLYQHGRVYTRPRAVFEAVREIMYRARINELRFRTLDQHKPGNSATEILALSAPQYEVANVH